MLINNVFNVMSPVCTMVVSVWGMPRKIGFVVLSSSGHEGDFSAEELMVHAPTVQGWRSARYLFIYHTLSPHGRGPNPVFVPGGLL